MVIFQFANWQYRGKHQQPTKKSSPASVYQAISPLKDGILRLNARPGAYKKKTLDADKVRFIMIHHHFHGILRTSIFLGTTIRVLKHTKTWCGAQVSYWQLLTLKPSKKWISYNLKIRTTPKESTAWRFEIWNNKLRCSSGAVGWLSQAPSNGLDNMFIADDIASIPPKKSHGVSQQYALKRLNLSTSPAWCKVILEMISLTIPIIPVICRWGSDQNHPDQDFQFDTISMIAGYKLYHIDTSLPPTMVGHQCHKLDHLEKWLYLFHEVNMINTY